MSGKTLIPQGNTDDMASCGQDRGGKRCRRCRLCGLRNLLTTVFLIVCVIALAASGGGDRREREQRRAKARHYYLAAAVCDATQRPAEAAELYKKAYETDTTYAEAALEYGVRRFGMPTDTLATPTERDRSRRIARKFIERYPGDFFPNVLYANIMERGENLDDAVAVIESLRKYNPGNVEVLQMLTGLYLDTHEFEKAMDAVEEYERIEGENLELSIRKAGMRIAMGDSIGALREAETMVEKYPRDPQYLLFKAQLQSFLNMQDSALLTYQAAERLNEPGYGGPVKIQLAEFYKNRGDSLNYDSKVYEALLAEDLDFDVKKEFMAYYLQTLVNDNGDRARGDKLFSVLLGQYPHEPELLSLAGRYSASKKDFARALEEVEYAIDLNHTNPQYHEQAIMYAYMLEDYDRLYEIFDKAKGSLEDMPVSMYSVAGSAAVIQDNPRRALDFYQEYMNHNFPGQNLENHTDMKKLSPYLTVDNIQDIVNIYQEAGDAYFKMEDREHAFVNYDNSLALEPDNALTLNNYAYFLVKNSGKVSEEDLAKADEMSKRAVTLAPDNATYIDTRAWVLFRSGQYKEAKDLQMRAIELIDEDVDDAGKAEFYGHLGDILFMNGEPEEALKAWETALDLLPEDELLQRKVKHKTFYYE